MHNYIDTLSAWFGNLRAKKITAHTHAMQCMCPMILSDPCMCTNETMQFQKSAGCMHIAS